MSFSLLHEYRTGVSEAGRERRCGAGLIKSALLRERRGEDWRSRPFLASLDRRVQICCTIKSSERQRRGVDRWRSATQADNGKRLQRLSDALRIRWRSCQRAMLSGSCTWRACSAAWASCCSCRMYSLTLWPLSSGGIAETPSPLRWGRNAREAGRGDGKRARSCSAGSL